MNKDYRSKLLMKQPGPMSRLFQITCPAILRALLVIDISRWRAVAYLRLTVYELPSTIPMDPHRGYVYRHSLILFAELQSIRFPLGFWRVQIEADPQLGLGGFPPQTKHRPKCGSRRASVRAGRSRPSFLLPSRPSPKLGFEPAPRQSPQADYWSNRHGGLHHTARRCSAPWVVA